MSISSHKSEKVVSMILSLLESKELRTCWVKRFSREDKLKISWNWVRSQYAGKRPTDQILAVVEACEILCETEALKDDDALCLALQEQVEKMVLKGSFQSIMKAVVDAQNRSPTIFTRLVYLFRKAIKKESGSGDRRSKYKNMIRLLGYDHAKERKKRLQKVKLDRAQEELLVSAVELIQIQGEGGKKVDVEEVLKAMISCSELWLPLLSAVHPKSILLQQPIVSAALDALWCLIDKQQRQSLRVEFLITLKDDEISLLAAYCVLGSFQESTTVDQNKIEEWKALLSLECKRANSFCERFAKVKQTVRFLQNVCEGCVVISDVETIIKEVNNRRKVRDDATLKDASDVSFWGTLDKLIGSSETAAKVRESIIFTNVAHLCLKENLASSQTALGKEADSSDDLPEYEAAEVLHILENEGLRQFREACTSLTDSNKDPKSLEVHMLLSGIDTEEALNRELLAISSFCGTSVPKRKNQMLKNYLSFPLVCAKVEQLMSIYAALGFENSEDEAVSKDLQDFRQVSSGPISDLTLTRVSEIVEKKSVARVNSELDDTLKTIMETLQESSELISFMKETANEDIRILIDAVEEHSDQFVSEAIVSDLIDVHGFLRNIIRETPEDPMMFLVSLKECYLKLEKKSEMAAKISECGCNVHSLRGLYMNVANRGEMTKEIINNAVQKGCYVIKTNLDGSSDVQLSYRRNESAAKDTTYNMTELHDLRSRALLILNTDKKQEQVENLDDSSASVQSVNQTLPTFITQVEMITDIVNVVTLLRESGHPKYISFWQKLTSSYEIESQALSLQSTLQDWETLLKRLQEQYYFLNFFHPDQLWLLHKFFSKPSTNTQSRLALTSSVHSLLRFVDPSIQPKELDDFRCHYNAPKGDSGLEIDLQAIGEVLDSIFIPRQGAPLKKILQHDLQRAVKPGELFVAVLELGSKQTANVVMSLFESTTGSFPQPSQVLFCHSETSWEEVERLLKRSFEAYTHSTSAKLHCLANVENLSNDMQFELVTAIRTYQKNVDGSYLLALVCCGGIHHHIADQFSTAAHNILGMSEPKLRDTFKKVFPNVFMVTSDLPGVGKTEAIHEHAASYKKKVLTVPISGPLSRKNLLKRLSGLSVSSHECIHFDVGEVDDPLVLDTMMFELIVVGMMSCGTELFHLPTKHVYIEIANTLRHWLQDSLPITKCFSPLHKNLVGYGDLVVSQEPLSPVQVVCQYLHAYESGSLETKDLNLVDLKPLSPDRCKQLLSKHFSSTGDLSYNIVESFLKVFADQLLQFSESPFFKTHNLQAALGLQHDVRNCLFKALLEVSREFASRSVVTCKNVQSEAISKEQASEVLKKLHSSSRSDAERMVERVEGMIQWADNNHLVIAFHRLEAFTISALYRDLSQVPSNVQKLLKKQAKRGEDIKDFAKLNHRELQERLDLIVRTKPRQNDDSLQKLDYALTPDNILKMVLIIQRIKARIPVIVMGETGCGKTSLVRYLARTCGVPFHVFNFHAGVAEEEVIDFIDQRETEAKTGKEVWVFLDEINTCEYLGTINEVICHRSIKGKPITSNLVFIAACNPYRLRPLGKITTAGLSEKIETDQFSKLVYRVHPLPETMIDFVWDYGSLGKDDEHAYIGRMVEGITGKTDNLLADLLCTSQQYIREVDGSPYCVSLRDAHRCIVLVKWFGETLKERNDLPLTKFKGDCACHVIARRFPNLERSFVLALAHCYQSRLPTAEARKGYQQRVAECFRKHKKHLFKEQSFEAIVRAEQEDYLERMELPEGTAKNGALRENVFVMLVCILNRIPVFVVGKPGCSKSLSMQIIRSNLRGKDAKDPFLKKFPQLYVVSHQGSESSTSDGILKVFEKARKYKEHNKSGDILPVVLLDEIGLAEVSQYNPLKVLHSLLEPGDGAFPDVAVVGISNWALDAAKMNRAIHLSRPEPDVDDLFDTGKSLREAGSERTAFGVPRTRSGHPHRRDTYPDDKQLLCLAEAYHEYQGSQKYANFHGLRDYYSLIKCLSSNRNHNPSHHPLIEEKTQGIQHALQRNFGGVPSDVNNFQTLFQKRLHSLDLVENTHHFKVTQLIRDNLLDKLARHLMIITNGDAAIGILDQTLQSLDKEKITIFGSRFEEDLSEEYNYRMLSRIILCMERDCVLILRDLENIYGSLYDMLNQNYTVVGGKRNCRVALGAFSNPMCQVHDGFRCIVLIDQRRVDFTDPPFLNRFEKQLLRFTDVLDGKRRSIISSLNEWVKSISTIPEFESQFHEEDMFVGFCSDTLPSLVLKNSQEEELGIDEILEKCKADLMLVASPDGVLRSLESSLAEKNFEEVQALYKTYFEMPLHNGLKEYLKHSLEGLQLDDDATSGIRLLIMTHSNIHVNVAQCLSGLLRCQTEKLSAFKSEKHLTKQLERFWKSSDALLVLQCKPELDATHMLLAKSIIEQQRQRYEKESMETAQSQIKHVCIIVHVQRESEANGVESQHWQFSFQSGWKQVTIDVLEPPVLPITECLEVSVIDLMDTKSLSFTEVASNEFLWCFTRIKYPAIRQPSVDEILKIEQLLRLPSNAKILECFKELVKRWLNKRLDNSFQHPEGRTWQFSVACDRQALIRSSHLVGAIQHYVSHLIRHPLAKIIYFLEEKSAWPKFLYTQDPSDEEELQVWSELILDQEILNIEDIPDHQGAESYFVPERHLHLKFPLAAIFSDKVDRIQPLFAEDQRQLLLNEANLDENRELHDVAAESQLHRFSAMIKEKIPQVVELEYLQQNIGDYVEDLIDMKTVHFSDVFTREKRIEFLKSAMANDIKFRIDGDPARLITRLHSLFWLNETMYTAALQVYATCSKIKHVDLTKLFCKLSTVFEEILFQSKAQLQCEEVDEAQYDKKAVNDLEEESDLENEHTEEESDLENVHTEEEISDDGAIDETSFDEILVETLCSALFPTSDVIESFEGPDNWQRMTSLFLSTVSRLQVVSPAFHFLRVCYDFVTLLVLPESLEPYSLYMLGSLGVMGNSEGYLDSQDVFDRIVNVVDEVAKRGVQQERLEDFLMLFYGRCIDSNPDTPVLGSILARICRSGQKSLIQLAGPLVHRVFLVEEELSPGVFEKLLDHPETIGDNPGLQEISYALSTLPGDVELDSPFAVVCCDLINEVAFSDIDFSTVSGSEDRLLLNFRKACQIVMEPTEDVEPSATEDEDVEQGAFHLLCAVAYLKAFLTSFCAFILENSSHLVEDGEFSMLMNELNAAFTLNGADQLRDTRISELQVYFLKELKKNLPMYQIYTLCQTSCKLPALKMIQWQDDNLVTKLSFDPFQSFSETSEVQAALATLLEKKNMKPFEDVIASMSQSVEIRVEAATVLAKSFFLVRSRRALKDSEDKAIASVIEKMKNVETPYVNLLQRITGKKDFSAPRLCVSPESSPEDVHRSTLILHLCIILASSFTSIKKGTPAMMSYFVDPMASVNSFVLASGEGGSQPFKRHWNYDVTRQLKTASSSFSCGTFYVVVGDGKEASCPNESEKKGIPNEASAQEGMLPSKGYVSLLNSDDFSLCVRQLKPAEFRILHLFVHAALYGGFALELFDNSSLGQFLNTKPKEGSPSEICFQQISNDLKVLCSILNAKEEEVLRFLHCALEECSSILTSANICSSPDERLSWEKKFASSIGPLLREFHPRKLLKRSVDASSSATQRKIEETDNPQFSEMNERNLHIPRLLRVTLPKTFNALKSYYMLTEDKERDKFPLLGLFLDFDDRLPLVRNLVHLVSWSRIVDSLLSRRLNRKDINKKIGDVIREKAKSPAERKQLKEAFKNFTAAFEEMRPLLKEQLQREVPYVSESSPISFCLVEKRDQGVFLCVAMEVLQKIQNDFMQKVLSIGATGKSSALIFLERDEGKCSIPMVHVQEAREKEIIQYQWSDAILRNSQRNTEYGHGKEVFYDLAKIEKEMAARFLVGKAFLSTFDGLREFIFSRELFHTCRGILDELQKLIPQQPLTEILRSGLVRKHSLESVQELLEHMEIVLCLLKRHEHGKPEEPLTEFTDKWLGGSRPFPKQLLPQPHSAIQLMHVVALYEFLEDTLAESAAKRVHDTYRATIPKEITDDLAKAAFFSGKSETNRSTLRAITIALRRFIFRYLSSEEMRPEPGEGLAERMRESSLWPMDLNKSGKSLGVESLENVLHLAFPESLTIGQTYQILCFYQDRLKVS
ncbi:unnamed protein product, partial [Pocillopora meandrina]